MTKLAVEQPVYIDRDARPKLSQRWIRLNLKNGATAAPLCAFALSRHRADT